MADSLAGIVLAAGAGTRLRPLTDLRPKPLCPVGDRPLLDWALDRLAPLVGGVAVNAHHLADAVVDHVGDRAHVSVERPEALGTAGAVAHLRRWLDGRAALVVNGDTWSTVPLVPLAEGWDGERVRLLVHGPPRLGPRTPVVGCLLPAAAVASLPEEPSGLYETCWRPAAERGRLEVLSAPGSFVACDRPVDYLAANLAASGGAPVVGEGARVDGVVVRSVVWPGATVRSGEVLVDAVRADERVTVLVR